MPRTVFSGNAIAMLLVLHLGAAGPTRGQTHHEMREAREHMVREFIVGSGISDARVIQAMRATPRHEFVPRKLRARAYFDMALPIGDQQTISSPFIVAYMTEALEPRPTDKVLEIGTGSGYQAAVLSKLVRDVFSIEIVPALGIRARRTLRRLGYDNVHVKVADGFAGWPDQAPFDKIIVTCSPENIPPALVSQLREEGRMVVPVGQRYQQTLFLFRKKNGQLISESLRPTLFVPMTGRAESQRVAQPDPLKPQVVNGGFEQSSSDMGQIAGWYYQRQLKTIVDKMAPEGSQYVAFRNTVAARPSLALQGFAIDGRQIGRVRISAWVKCDAVLPGPQPQMLPKIAVTFYDRNRRELSTSWLGPWRDTQPWQKVASEFRVPQTAREAILRIGMFGAVGQFSIDDVRIEPSRQSGRGRHAGGRAS